MKNKFGTLCVHAGEGHNPFGAHATPIYQTSTYVFESAEQAAATFSGGPGYRYIRSPPNTPTHAAFIDKICSLEGGKAGLAFSSGMAAETTLVLSKLQKGDHLLSTDVIYGGTFGLFSSLLPKFGIDVSFVDTTNLQKVTAGLQENTRLIFLESPANPTMAVSDIGEIGKIAHEAGALLAVDNTFATPYFQRPLALGADVVVESCTKYIGGHGDLLGGVAVGSQELISSMRRTALLSGGTMGTHEAWLCLRGCKTLHLRMERHAENALHLAQFLQKNPAVEKVNYPGLSSHPQHALAARQMSGWGGMLSFEVRGGVEAGRRLMDHLKLASLAVSLGSVDTLVEHPASMTHAVMPKEMREKMGITDGLVRVSVGIEDIEDILADFEQGLDKVAGN
ncbi:MAG: aminotransferase class I/II-fold pyridoxal phosphate-dependent enzyme [Methanothrix sp.]|nr:aminotransferase class I/II-fold pyridoxal phosphate-dependent enzyme [Methanothrix sp.]